MRQTTKIPGLKGTEGCALRDGETRVEVVGSDLKNAAGSKRDLKRSGGVETIGVAGPTVKV